MSYHGWYSKKDVLKDLRRVGQRGRLGRALDEGHVIVGEQPPPQAVYMPDEETELHVRSLCGGQLPDTHNRVVQPDLAGIARMLRMIDGPDEEPPKEIQIKKEPRKEETTNRLVVISKLNPNSKEFIPSFNVTNKTDVKEEPKKTDECIPMTLNNDRTDTNKIPEKEKVALDKKMRDQDLRKKIIDNSNTVCPKVTKDRNVAIVSLLKLHSQDPVGLNNEGNDITGKRIEVCPNVKGDCNDATMTVPTLKTPAYYEKCPDQKCPEEFLPPKCNKANPASIASAAPIDHGVTEKNNLETAANIVESVNKVEKWLQDTTNSNKNVINEQKTKVDEIKIVLAQEDTKITTPKKQMIHLGPITFKRKNSKPASPSSTLNSDVTENQKPKKEKCDEYKPSEYAEQLARKYAEHNNNLKANQENILTWKILTEIKAKEEKIMREKALAEKRAQSQEQTDEASNTCVAL